MKKALLIIGIIILAIKGCSLLLPEMCANDIFSEVVSPNQSLKAVTFQRDCGATTGYSTQISIIKNSASLPNDGGNVLIISGHPKDMAPKIKWSPDSSRIKIYRKLDGSEFLASTSVGWFSKTNVEYETDGG